MLEYSTPKVINCGQFFVCIFLKMEWAQFDQSLVDAAICQFCRHLSACVRVCGAHFMHKFSSFWNKMLYKCKFC